MKLPKMTDKEVEELINQQILCRIAFRDKEYPYIAPFQYVTMNGTLYFHFTNYGKKVRMLEADNRVCVEIESYSPNLQDYRFVSLRGKLEIVKDPEERTHGISKLMREGQEKLSRNFLMAHGIPASEDWRSLDPEKPLVLVKLSKTVERVGLKSAETSPEAHTRPVDRRPDAERR